MFKTPLGTAISSAVLTFNKLDRSSCGLIGAPIAAVFAPNAAPHPDGLLLLAGALQAR